VRTHSKSYISISNAWKIKKTKTKKDKLEIVKLNKQNKNNKGESITGKEKKL